MSRRRFCFRPRLAWFWARQLLPATDAAGRGGHGLGIDRVCRGLAAGAAARRPFGARIYQLSPEGIRPIAYEQTEHYKITQRFLTQRRRSCGSCLKRAEVRIGRLHRQEMALDCRSSSFEAMLNDSARSFGG